MTPKRESTRKIHDEIRQKLDRKVERLKKQGKPNPVETACREMNGHLDYSWRTLMDIYYGY